MERPFLRVLVLAVAFQADADADTVLPGAGSVQLNGNAQLSGSEFVLSNGASQLSSVWYQTPIALDQAFRVSFQYRPSNYPTFGNPGDGLAIVLQGTPAGLSALGQPGSGSPGYGYGGITNSLALTLDLRNQTMNLYQDGSTTVANQTDWNTQAANGQWEHGVPGFPLPAGVDPDASPVSCSVGAIVLEIPGASCSVGSFEFGIDGDWETVYRLYDHYYVGHGSSNLHDVEIVEDLWIPIQMSFMPNLQTNDGSLAVLYDVAGVANGVGYVGVANYWYLPNTPIPADNSFFVGLPEYDPESSAEHYFGFTASTGSFEYGEQRIRGWTIETGIENDFWDYAVPVPEPSTATLLGVGMLALAARARRRQ